MSRAHPMAGDVFTVAITNPYFEGATNVYVLAGDGLALIDTGIGTPAALAELDTGLAERGLGLDAIVQVFLTHKHPDHIGLARTIAERTGATVYIHEEDLPHVANYSEHGEKHLQNLSDRLRAWGTPGEIVDRVFRSLADAGALGQTVPVEPLAGGDRIATPAGELSVLHTPGHTPGSVCFQLGPYLFTGDHVLPRYTPNIGAGDLGGEGLLDRYLDALERVRALTHTCPHVLPGHGHPIPDLGARVQEILDHHAERERLLVALLADRPLRSVYDLALDLFGRLESYHVALGTGEVYAHLQRLADAGRARAEPDHRWRLEYPSHG